VHLPQAELARALDTALRALPQRRLYLRIAWACASEGAIEHALLVARRSAQAFPEEPELAQEYEEMRTRLRSPGAAALRGEDAPAIALFPWLDPRDSRMLRR
jgi:hypothetical protein